MTRKNWLIAVLVFGALYCWNSYYPNFLLAGSYLSNNSTPILEGPTTNEVLILYLDGTFKSQAWGNGTYELDGPEIMFKYVDRMGSSGYFLTSVYRPFFLLLPRISLNQDLNYYFEKVEIEEPVISSFGSFPSEDVTDNTNCD